MVKPFRYISTTPLTPLLLAFTGLDLSVLSPRREVCLLSYYYSGLFRPITLPARFLFLLHILHFSSPFSSIVRAIQHHSTLPCNIHVFIIRS
ncbi:hypothetical protein M407DRAFT_203370 [Tulasnella calospora MUT 4182]|uniref:Uncharacterized protein n=1 Tax=Tulasnella calospora MUT 4182 TaxID=1051891 RepID=A0A0C3Q8H2_9AGAM|nr:hypothetical protein M407DRAFT_203370 [Tulasnella calospora MUT 4182]